MHENRDDALTYLMLPCGIFPSCEPADFARSPISRPVVLGTSRPPVTWQVNSRQEFCKLFLRKQVCGEKGVRLLEWRKLVCGVIIIIMPTSLIAQDSAQAMLHNDGGVWLNGNPAPNSSAIFLHDLVQTQKGNWAKIDADGSTVTVQPETIVQFEGDVLVLDHGGLQVNTSRGLKVRVNCITVIPLTQDWNRYDVTDVDGRVVVAAHQNDDKIHYRVAATRLSKKNGSSDVTVHQGEQVTREERCGAPAKPAAELDAAGAILNTPWVVGVGSAAVVALTCWALCRGDEPVSAAK